jgi:hypothetical protein
VNAALVDKLWSAYASYVLAHCPRRSGFGGGFVLDEMAVELQDTAVSYETHGTL